MSCACPVINDQLHTTDTTAFELGPAHAFFEAGGSVERRWRQGATLPHFILDPCCSKLEYDPEYFNPALNWGMLALAWTLFFIMVAAVARFGAMQPLRYRGKRDILIVNFLAAAHLSITSAVGAGDISSRCSPMVVTYFCFAPAILLYYSTKSLQLGFAFRWQQAKRDLNVQRMQWFREHLWVLSPNAYPIIVAVWVVIAGIAVAVLLTQMRLFGPEKERDTYADELRCFWWQIPSQYQQPTSSSPFCACVRGNLDLPPAGNSTAAEEAATCGLASIDIYNACVSFDSARLAELGVSFNLCIACQNGFSDPTCTDYITQTFFLTGACGFPAQMPDMGSCKTCLAANHTVVYSYTALISLLCLLNVAAGLFVSRDDDKFLIRAEVLLGASLEIPLTVLLVLDFLSPAAADVLAQGIITRYNVVSLLATLLGFSVMLASMVLPLAGLAQNLIIESRSPHRRSNERSQGSDHDSGAAVPRKRATSANPAEEGLEFALTMPEAGRIFAEFSSKEFTIENFRFLSAVRQLSSASNIASPIELAKQVRYIYHVYVEPGAPLEINLRGNNRAMVKAAIVEHECITHAARDTPEARPAGGMRARALFASAAELLECKLGGDASAAASRFEDVTGRIVVAEDDRMLDGEVALVNGQALVRVPATRDEAAGWFAPAVVEIRRLITTDSWPRFSSAAEFGRFNELFVTTATMDSVLQHVQSDSRHSRASESHADDAAKAAGAAAAVAPTPIRASVSASSSSTQAALTASPGEHFEIQLLPTGSQL
jgi:hypothetical protein